MPLSLARAKTTLTVLTLAAGLFSYFVTTGVIAPAQASDEVTVVVLATPSADGQAARKEYSEKVNPLGKEAGVRIINGVKIKDSLVGKLGYKAVFLLGFDSEKAARDFFSSDKYRALIPLRNAGYDQYNALIGR